MIKEITMPDHVMYHRESGLNISAYCYIGAVYPKEKSDYRNDRIWHPQPAAWNLV